MTKPNDFPIHLFSLPGELYVNLDDRFKEDFFNAAIKVFGTKSELCREMGVKRSNIDNWMSSSIPLYYLKKISNYCYKTNKYVFHEQTIERYVTKLRGKTQNFGINSPNLPITLTPELASVMGHFLGDGGIKKRDLSPMYCNIYNDIIDEFLGSLNCFGEVDYTIRKDGKIIYISLPSTLGIILVKCFNFIPGKKSKRKDARAPKFIRKSTNSEILSSFIRALYDDEGSINVKSKAIRIEMANELLVRDIKDAISKLGIHPGVIRKQVHHGGYGTSEEWYFDIYSQLNLIQFYKIVKTKCKEKEKKLTKMIEAYQTPPIYLILSETERKQIFKGVTNKDLHLPYITLYQWRKGKKPIPIDMLLKILKMKSKNLKLRKPVKVKVRNSGRITTMYGNEFNKLLLNVGMSNTTINVIS